MERGAKRAVLVSLELTQDGSKISLDDVVQTDVVGDWKQAEHFTHKAVTGDLLNLSEAELAAFGYHILARLNAFKSGGEV